VLELNLEEANKNIAMYEAEKVEEAVYKPFEYEIYQTAISDHFETLRKKEEKENSVKSAKLKTAQYSVFVGQQR
jgi:hypothetical protein